MVQQDQNPGPEVGRTKTGRPVDHKSARSLKPWIAEGLSRSAWYAKRKKAKN